MAQSESIKNLIPALISARKTFKPLEKGRENPFFHSKYASLDDVLEATDEALSQHGLVVLQSTDGPVLRSILAHSSGEWIDGLYTLAPAKQNDPQALGAAVTYARRYALQGLLGICAEEDDDGNRASRPAGASQSRPAASPAPSPRPAALPPQGPPDREPGLDEEDFPTRKVTDVKEKTGTSKSGKPYSLFTVTFEDGSKATTFDRTVAAEAQLAANHRMPVIVAMEEGSQFQKFKTYDLTSFKIVNPQG